MDYPKPARSNILDWLFLPKYGAGFHHLKVEVGVWDKGCAEDKNPSREAVR